MSAHIIACILADMFHCTKLEKKKQKKDIHNTIHTVLFAQSHISGGA